MFALIGNAQRMFAEPCAPAVEADAIQSLLGRVRRLLDAECVVALEYDPATRIAGIVATVGQAGDIDALEASLLGLARRLGRDAADPAGAVEVARLSSASGHGEVLVVQVGVAGASLLIVATRELAPFTINEERAARRMSDWIGDFMCLWWRQRRDRQRGDSLHAALDLVGVAVFVLDGQGRLIDTNGAARVLLDAGDGLRKVGSMLTACSLEDSARLQTAIAHAGSGDHAVAGTTSGASQQAPVLSIRREGARPLSVAVMRGDRGSGGDGRVVVHAVDPQGDVEQPLLPACAIYGLTGAETRLAKLLVGGASVVEAAARLQIQPPTARTYLKQVFAKTGTNRQAALVQLLLTSIVRTGPGVELTALQ
ncbi:hypothetical protein KX816_18150 [Sphingosinicellaceae bacterium]|nr:hypothetical protein KX816_18150 [Sphingosinicellaceae bacterium]